MHGPHKLKRLRAEMDCIVAMSACPQDILPFNGANRQITDIQYQVLASSSFAFCNFQLLEG